MSSGHFTHEESYLDYIADQLEQDIKYSEVPWDHPVKTVIRNITASNWNLKPLIISRM